MSESEAGTKDVTFYYEPKLTLVMRPQFIEPTHLPCEWVGEAEPGERLAEYAGRVCYMSYHNPAKRTNRDYLDNIISSRHGSVLENVVYGVLIEQVSRSLTHELIRHHAGVALSQLSQRFVDESEAAFVVPPAMIGRPALEAPFRAQCVAALGVYGSLVEELMATYTNVPDKTLRRKMAREAARAVLPNATETKLVWTANLRAIRHILELRGSPHADQEIRRWAVALFQLLWAEAPNVFADITLQDDGTLAVEHSKV